MHETTNTHYKLNQVKLNPDLGTFYANWPEKNTVYSTDPRAHIRKQVQIHMKLLLYVLRGAMLDFLW